MDTNKQKQGKMSDIIMMYLQLLLTLEKTSAIICMIFQASPGIIGTQLRAVFVPLGPPKHYPIEGLKGVLNCTPIFLNFVRFLGQRM